MAGRQYNIIFNCTPAQLETALITTLPAVGFIINRAPIQYQGTVVGGAGGTGTSAGLGQIDFSYDGQFFLRFIGGTPVPTAGQTSAGIPEQQISPALITLLTSTLAATLGAPVPSNQAVPPYYNN